MSDTSHDILDILPEPHRALAKQRRADAAREAQTPNSDIPRHLRLAIASATRAFQSGDLSTLGTANEDIQPMIDAAVAWGRRMRDDARADAAEIRRVLDSEIGNVRAALRASRSAHKTAVGASLRLQEMNDALTAEVVELRLTLAAERGEPEGAPSEGWCNVGADIQDTYWQKATDRGVWVVTPTSRIERLTVARGQHRRASLIGPDVTICTVYAMTDRAAMLAADERLNRSQEEG